MTLLEFTAAAAIAVYAMVGSAFLNAAITAPQNTAKILHRIWPELYGTYLIGGLVILGATVLAFVIMGVFIGPLLAISAAHILSYVLMLAARQIVEILLENPTMRPPE